MAAADDDQELQDLKDALQDLAASPPPVTKKKVRIGLIHPVADIMMTMTTMMMMMPPAAADDDEDDDANGGGDDDGNDHDVKNVGGVKMILTMMMMRMIVVTTEALKVDLRFISYLCLAPQRL